MGITLFIIGILLLIFLWRFWTVIFFQLRITNNIKINLPQATQSYCILGFVDELEEFSNKLCKIVDKLLNINKTVKIAVSLKKVKLQCFLTDEEIEFLEEYFF